MKEVKSLGRLGAKTTFVKVVLHMRKKFGKKPPTEIAAARSYREKNMKRVCGKPLAEVKSAVFEFGEYRARVYNPPEVMNEETVILYLHGGAYIGSNIDIYDGFVSRFCREMKLSTYSFDYPLAPEKSYPHALGAVLAFYKFLVGKGHKKIILAGDSAGGGLALACVNRLLHKEHYPVLPQMLLLFSPWVDLTLSYPSIVANKKKDLLVTREVLTDAARMYCGVGADPKNPEVSPIFDDFKYYPPAYILAGNDELLRDEVTALHDCMERDGVDVYLSVWKGMQHAFVVGANLFPESKKVIAHVKEFVQKRL